MNFEIHIESKIVASPAFKLVWDREYATDGIYAYIMFTGIRFSSDVKAFYEIPFPDGFPIKQNLILPLYQWQAMLTPIKMKCQLY